MPTKKIALFIDADNISSKLVKLTIDTPESRGEIFIRRIYGNRAKMQPITAISLRRLSDFAKAHDDLNGFTNLSHAGNAIAQKNFSVKNFGHSSLKDFVSAFPKLYELHKTKKNIYYRCQTKTTSDVIKKIHGVLQETATTLGDKKGFVDLTCAGQNLHDKNLTIKGSGHATLSKFISAFPQLYELKKNTYRCK